jgi:hypothetical protein
LCGGLLEVPGVIGTCLTLCFQCRRELKEKSDHMGREIAEAKRSVES